MNLCGRTVLVTGGGTGIGRGLAEALHGLGNTVIVAGRRVDHLKAVAAASPGIRTMALDITDPSSIARVAHDVVERHPGSMCSSTTPA